MQLHQLTPHVHWLPADSTTDRPILGVVSGRHSTLIVDAGNSMAHANLLLAEMARLGLAPPSYVVLTHSHWDHVFGLPAFAALSIATQETKQIVAEMVTLDWSDAALDERVAAGTEIEFCRDMIKVELPDRRDLSLKAPEIAFAGEIEIDLGQVTCRIAHVGGDHASDSAIVYVPEDKVFFLGDCLYEDLHHGPRHYTTAQLFPLIERLLSYEAEFYVWSHHPAPLPRAELVEFTTLLKRIGHLVEQNEGNRAVIETELLATSNGALDEDTKEVIEAFLAGLPKVTRGS